MSATLEMIKYIAAMGMRGAHVPGGPRFNPYSVPRRPSQPKRRRLARKLGRQ